MALGSCSKNGEIGTSTESNVFYQISICTRPVYAIVEFIVGPGDGIRLRSMVGVVRTHPTLDELDQRKYRTFPLGAT